MRIKIKIVKVYGQVRAYPQCETGRKLLDLVGQKSFTADQVRIISDLGIDIEFVKSAKSRG